MRRALEIDESSFGPEHPNVAIDLNNLAQLLQDTHRLEEAEPLMRQSSLILLNFTSKTGHEHPSIRTSLKNYKILLDELSLSQAERTEKLDSLGPEANWKKEEWLRWKDDVLSEENR